MDSRYSGMNDFIAIQSDGIYVGNILSNTKSESFSCFRFEFI